jgi:hypothetical protein
MSAQSKLKQALDAIDDARRRLKRLSADLEDDSEIRRAIRELDDAEADIERALSDVRRAD